MWPNNTFCPSSSDPLSFIIQRHICTSFTAHQQLCKRQPNHRGQWGRDRTNKHHREVGLTFPQVLWVSFEWRNATPSAALSRVRAAEIKPRWWIWKCHICKGHTKASVAPFYNWPAERSGGGGRKYAVSSTLSCCLLITWWALFPQNYSSESCERHWTAPQPVL